MPSAHALAALAAVAQALKTLVNGMPDSPTMPTIASGLATVQLPPDGELDVLPLDAGVGDSGEDGVDAHLHRGLALEPAERVQPNPDDRDVVHLGSSSLTGPLPRRVYLNCNSYSISCWCRR